LIALLTVNRLPSGCDVLRRNGTTTSTSWFV